MLFDNITISLTVAAIAAVAAIVSAISTAVMARFSWRLAKSTEDYVRLTQEQLQLLRAQLTAPLFLEAELISDLVIRCRHSGGPSSLPVIVTGATVHVYPAADGVSEELREVPLNEVLRPGKTWSRAFREVTALNMSTLPTPHILSVFRGQPREKTVARLSITLRLRRGTQSEPEELTKEFEVRTRAFGVPKLVAL